MSKFTKEDIENYIVDLELGYVVEDNELEELINNNPEYRHIRETQQMLSEILNNEKNILFNGDEFKKEALINKIIKFRPTFNSFKWSSVAVILVFLTFILIPKNKNFLSNEFEKSVKPQSTTYDLQEELLVDTATDEKVDLVEEVKEIALKKRVVDKKELSKAENSKKELKGIDKKQDKKMPKKKIEKKSIKVIADSKVLNQSKPVEKKIKTVKNEKELTVKEDSTLTMDNYGESYAAGWEFGDMLQSENSFGNDKEYEVELQFRTNKQINDDKSLWKRDVLQAEDLNIKSIENPADVKVEKNEYSSPKTLNELESIKGNDSLKEKFIYSKKIITGFEDGKTYNKAIIIKITKNKKYSYEIFLNDEIYILGTKISKEGTYKVNLKVYKDAVLVDERTKYFTIDYNHID